MDGIRVFIVYEGEFETDKPRSSDAEPYIRLVTVDKEKALEEFYRLKEKILQQYDKDDVYVADTYVEYDGYKVYRRIGIIDAIVQGVFGGV